MNEEPSKTQKKREVEALQILGNQLVKLRNDQLDNIPLTDELRRAIEAARHIKSHGATRRQAQLIGKLMRNADSEAIREAYEGLLFEGSSQSQLFHEVEQWRERLIKEDNQSLSLFIDTYKPEAIQQLRQLIQKARDDLKKQKNTGAQKALFRFIRSCLS